MLYVADSNLPTLWDVLTTYMVPVYPLIERESSRCLAELLSTAEGRAKYKTWQQKEHETWALIKREASAKDQCRSCKGTGKIPLFTSLADCTDCGASGGVPDKVKQKLISEYIRTPAGRRKLAASLSPVRRGVRDYPS